MPRDKDYIDCIVCLTCDGSGKEKEKWMPLKTQDIQATAKSTIQDNPV